MFATLTLRRSVPVSLPTWGAIGGFTMVVGLGVAAVELLTATHAPRAKSKAPVEQVAFDRLVVDARTFPLDSSIESPSDARVVGRIAAVVYARGSAISMLDVRSGTPLATLGSPAVAANARGAELVIAPADSGRWALLDRSHSTVDLVTDRGKRVWQITLPRGLWSTIAWDSAHARVLVTGVEVGASQSRSDGRSIHEFDQRGVEVASYRELAPVTHRLQASFNLPFAAIDGSIVLSGSSLSNEVSVFDRASARERFVLVADEWFTPINWELPRQSTAATTVAEPTLSWLARQTMLTAAIPLAHGRFIARFTQHGRDRERYLYALVDSLGRTRALTVPTTVKLGGAVRDTVSGLDFSDDGKAKIFVGVLARPSP